MSNPQYLQTITFAYEVQGGLDGVTLAPASSVDAAALDAVQPNAENQIYPVVIEGNLGIIDPDYGGGNGGHGDRYIQFIEILSPTPGGLNSSINVVDVRESVDGEATEIRVLETLPPPFATPSSFLGEGQVYLRTCVFVPQGAALQLVGWPADPGGAPILVRIHFLGALDSVAEEACLQEACCCEENERNDQFFPEPCDPPVADTINPGGATQGQGGGSIGAVISGSNFLATDTVTSLPPGLILGSAFVNDTTINVGINTNAAVGAYAIFVERENDPECRDNVDAVFNITLG